MTDASQQRHPIKIYFVSDPEQKIAKAYHISSWPHCMVLDKKGIIHYSGVLGAFADAVVADLLAAKPVPAAPRR